MPTPLRAGSRDGSRVIKFATFTQLAVHIAGPTGEVLVQLPQERSMIASTSPRFIWCWRWTLEGRVALNKVRFHHAANVRWQLLQALGNLGASARRRATG